MPPGEAEQQAGKWAILLEQAGKQVEQAATQAATEAVDQVRSSIAGSIETLHGSVETALTNWLAEMRSPLTVFPVEGIGKIFELWNQWQNKFQGSTSTETREFEKAAWNLFTKEHLDVVAKRIEKQFVITNTHTYTDIYRKATNEIRGKWERLSPTRKKGRRILRYHITSMLPEEFYNGPQIERLTTTSTPLLFAHRWEDFTNFYLPESPEVAVRRCIVVRDVNNFDPLLGSISTEAELKTQANLLISDPDRPRHVKQLLDTSECPAVRSRLIKRTGRDEPPEKEHSGRGFADERPDVLHPQDVQRVEEEMQLIRDILRIEQFHYCPIVDCKDCAGRGCQCRNVGQWTPLLRTFAGQPFHNHPDDALYCIITSKEWGKIHHCALLMKCFRAGWTPEIVLIGEEKDDEPIWYFGIVGHYLPFTDLIELSLLNADETRSLFSAFTTIICGDNGGKPHRLLDLLPNGI